MNNNLENLQGVIRGWEARESGRVEATSEMSGKLWAGKILPSLGELVAAVALRGERISTGGLLAESLNDWWEVEKEGDVLIRLRIAAAAALGEGNAEDVQEFGKRSYEEAARDYLQDPSEAAAIGAVISLFLASVGRYEQGNDGLSNNSGGIDFEGDGRLMLAQKILGATQLDPVEVVTEALGNQAGAEIYLAVDRLRMAAIYLAAVSGEECVGARRLKNFLGLVK